MNNIKRSGFCDQLKILVIILCFSAIYTSALGQTITAENPGFGLPDSVKEDKTTTSTPSTTRNPSSGPKIRQCGLHKDKTCVRRSECATTLLNGPKLIIDLKEPSRSGCHYLEVCCHSYHMLTPMETSIPSEHNQCGVSNVAGVFMTLKGGRLETSFAEYPWTAAIFDTRNKFLCNGVLISYKVVLTTATCLAPYQPLIVRAGDWDLATDRETVPHKTREVQDHILHEQFNWDSMQDNIALLILKEEFPRLQHIVPICLIQEGVDLDYKNCFVTGWNYMTSSRVTPSRHIALRVDMNIERSDCINSTSHKMLVATPRTEQPIYAKGAPLVCPTESSKFYVVGAWSTSLNGTIQFTDIRQFKNWIDQMVQP